MLIPFFCLQKTYLSSIIFNDALSQVRNTNLEIGLVKIFRVQFQFGILQEYVRGEHFKSVSTLYSGRKRVTRVLIGLDSTRS